MFDEMKRRSGGGFTLVELLVVVAVIALLIGVLLPALGGARRAAWQAQGASLQRQLLLGLQIYANDFDGFIPGTNTSGLRVEEWAASANGLDRSSRPVQNWDWLTYAVDPDDLPSDRGERFVHLLRRFQDPSNRGTLTAGGLVGASAGLAASVVAAGGVPEPSFLMPATWQWSGETVLEDGVVAAWGQPAEEASVAALPASYRPRIDRVGAGSGKVWLADGVPDLSSGEVDARAWVPVAAGGYGAFSSGTPIAAGSPSYDPESPFLGRSYRHDDRMNAGFFDGHVSALDVAASQDPGLWYPTRSVFVGSGAVDRVRDLVEEGELLP